MYCPAKQSQGEQGKKKGGEIAVILGWLTAHLMSLRSSLRGLNGTSSAAIAGILSTVLLATIGALLLPELPFPLIAESGVVIAGAGLTFFAVLNAERRKSAYRGIKTARRVWMMQLAVVPVTTILVLLGAVKLADGTVGGSALLAVVSMALWGRKLVQFEHNKNDLEVASLGTYRQQQSAEPPIAPPPGAPQPEEEAAPEFDADGFPVDPYGGESFDSKPSPPSPGFEPLPDEGSAQFATGQPADPPSPAEQDEPEQEKPKRTSAEILADFDRYIALEGVKRQMSEVGKELRTQRIRRDHGLPDDEAQYALILEGPPGTGKTESARLFIELLHAEGAISKGHMLEKQRADFIGDLWGKTTKKTMQIIDEADGGGLFIDEAPELWMSDEDQYGQEAVTTLNKQLEDRRGRFAVVLAGYPDEMEKFLARNPGFKSRFLHTIRHRAYTTEELVAITMLMFEKSDRTLEPPAETKLREVWRDIMDDPERDERTFGNGRVARNLFKLIQNAQAHRISDLAEQVGDEVISTDQVREVLAEDIEAGYSRYCEEGQK
jgi:DNA polymerase III delta prime subunit